MREFDYDTRMYVFCNNNCTYYHVFSHRCYACVCWWGPHSILTYLTGIRMYVWDGLRMQFITKYHFQTFHIGNDILINVIWGSTDFVRENEIVILPIWRNSVQAPALRVVENRSERAVKQSDSKCTVQAKMCLLIKAAGSQGPVKYHLLFKENAVKLRRPIHAGFWCEPS